RRRPSYCAHAMTLQRRLLRWLAYLAACAAGVLATLLLVFAVQARLRLPDLHAWHTVTLEPEFHAGRPDAPGSFPEYLALEERLFGELQRRVFADSGPIARYNPESVVARLALETKYNRSYELVPPGE